MISFKYFILFTIITVIFLRFYISFQEFKPHPHIHLPFPEIVKNFGYTLEEHFVTTEDGYILNLHHIKSPNLNATNRSILLGHGLTHSSFDYVISGPNKSLALLLVDNKYDVWLANYRGTKWSRNHTKLDPDKDAQQFFNYSFYEIGKYDLPCLIDYIQTKNGGSKLFFLGFSQSASTFLITMSERPEYRDKIKHASFLSPAVFTEDAQNLIIVGSDFLFKIYKYFFPNNVPVLEVAPYDSFMSEIFYFCSCYRTSILYQYIRASLYITQVNMGLIDPEHVPVVISKVSGGFALGQLLQLIQAHSRKKFMGLDYNKEANLRRYGQVEPPTFDLSKATMPIAVYYSKGDHLIVYTDIEKMIKLLPNVVKTFFISDERFNHLDFIYGLNISDFYQHVLNELEKY